MFKNTVLLFVLTSVILCAICGCSTNSLTSSKNSNVATTFASVVNGAPVMASDGTVFFNSLGTDGYENRFSSAKDLSFESNCLQRLKLNEDFSFENYDPEKDIRHENQGWLIYRKIGSQITYSSINPSEYLFYDSTVKSLTFTKMHQLIHS